MLKQERKLEIKKVAMSYESEDGSEKASVIYISDKNGESLRIGHTPQQAEKAKPLSFKMLSEIVKEVEKWTLEPKTTQTSHTPMTIPRVPKVVDHRNETTEEGDNPNAPTSIQKQVDDAMKNLGTGEEQKDIMSLSQDIEIVNESGSKIDDEEDPTGISLDELQKMGTTPETSPEMKNEFEEIARQRASAPQTKDPSKAVKRKY